MQTGLDHEHSEQITVAARWLAERWPAVPRPVPHLLRATFGLSGADLAYTIAEAKRIRSGAA